MSTAEVIAIIDKLPPEEQRQVRDYLDQKIQSGGEPRAGRKMDFAKAKAIGEGVFDRHPELFRKLAQ